MSRRALNHLARSLVEVLAEDEQRGQQMLQMQQALMQQGVRPMVMRPGPFGFLMQQPVLQFNLSESVYDCRLLSAPCAGCF